MLRVAIIASGLEYQEGAAWAAATFAHVAPAAAAVQVLIPAGEQQSPVLNQHAALYKFSVNEFPFKRISQNKFTSQLKCQGYLHIVSATPTGDVLLLVDADTYCTRPLILSGTLKKEIGTGKIGMVRDVKDRHFNRPRCPWYLRPEERVPYVNSGVILTTRSSIDLFDTFASLSAEERFLRGPFNDQKVINYALGKFFRDRLVILDSIYNGMRKYLTAETIIGHCAGGAGRFGSSMQNRKAAHQKICQNILDRNPGAIELKTTP